MRSISLAFLLLGAAVSAFGADPPAPQQPSANVKSTSKTKAAAKGAAATPTVNEEELKPFQDALDSLDAATDTKQMVEAMAIVRNGFPTSRPVVARASAKGSVKLRAFSVQVLGEFGDAENDLAAVSAALADDHVKVRLAAIMACRRLGKESCPALAAHLPKELDANNRKMTVKALQHWSYKEAVPLLVETLKVEKEKTVRNFIVTALEVLTGQKRGEDVASWQAYLESAASSEQAQELFKETKNTPTGGKP